MASLSSTFSFIQQIFIDYLLGVIISLLETQVASLITNMSHVALCPFPASFLSTGPAHPLSLECSSSTHSFSTPSGVILDQTSSRKPFELGPASRPTVPWTLLSHCMITDNLSACFTLPLNGPHVAHCTLDQYVWKMSPSWCWPSSLLTSAVASKLISLFQQNLSDRKISL